ncbi:MAG: hotdog fold thioesterase [Xanthomonadales bacterium]|nr:hotdog fold thioesterase [Xanthomonadales bacterium]
MATWRRSFTLEQMNQFSRNTLVDQLGIRFTELGEGTLTGTMPVDGRTTQPFGLLHGGASVALAETLGSMAGQMMVDEEHMVVGLDINANHLRAVRAGLVTGVASPVHIGRTTQVWEIHIHDEAAARVCISRLTLAVVRRGR